MEVGKHMFGLFSPSWQSNPSPRQSHVGRRNIQISPPPGDQDWSNALPQGQQRQSNPHPMPSFTDQIRWKLNILCMYEVSVFLYRMAGFTPIKPRYE